CLMPTFQTLSRCERDWQRGLAPGAGPRPALPSSWTSPSPARVAWLLRSGDSLTCAVMPGEGPVYLSCACGGGRGGRPALSCMYVAMGICGGLARGGRHDLTD